MLLVYLLVTFQHYSNSFKILNQQMVLALNLACRQVCVSISISLYLYIKMV